MAWSVVVSQIAAMADTFSAVSAGAVVDRWACAFAAVDPNSIGGVAAVENFLRLLIFPFRV